MGACSSPTTWVLGVELGFSGLVAGVLTTQQPPQSHCGTINITFALLKMIFTVKFKFIIIRFKFKKLLVTSLLIAENTCHGRAEDKFPNKLYLVACVAPDLHMELRGT